MTPFAWAVIVIAAIIAAFSLFPAKHHSRFALLATAGSIFAALLIAFLSPKPLNGTNGEAQNVLSTAAERTLQPLAQPAPNTPQRTAAFSADGTTNVAVREPAGNVVAQASLPQPSPNATATSPTTRPASQLEPPTAQASPTLPPPPAPPKPHAPERNGVSVVLDGLSEARDKYVATIRFLNNNSEDVGVALSRSDFARANGYMTDNSGGSCPMVANGDSFGSLNSATPGSNSSEFAQIAANGDGRQVLYFNKGRCEAPIRSRSEIGINVTFLVYLNHKTFLYPVSFSDLSFR